MMISIFLLLNPSVMIADEVNNGVGCQRQDIILEKFTDIWNSEVSLIVVTRDFDVIAKLADDLIVMKDEEIMEKGTVYEIFAKLRTAYTQRLPKSSLLVGEGANQLSYLPQKKGGAAYEYSACRRSRQDAR